MNTVMAKQFQHLNITELYRLITPLSKFEDLFEGTFCMWNTTQVDLELKDNANPVCLQPYPVTRVPKAMFKK